MIQELHRDLDLPSSGASAEPVDAWHRINVNNTSLLMTSGSSSLKTVNTIVRTEDDPVVHWELTTFTQAQVIHEDFPKAVLTTACCRLELV